MVCLLTSKQVSNMWRDGQSGFQAKLMFARSDAHYCIWHKQHDAVLIACCICYARNIMLYTIYAMCTGGSAAPRRSDVKRPPALPQAAPPTPGPRLPPAPRPADRVLVRGAGTPDERVAEEDPAQQGALRARVLAVLCACVCFLCALCAECALCVRAVVLCVCAFVLCVCVWFVCDCVALCV
jgi:hypothetical protein